MTAKLQSRNSLLWDAMLSAYDALLCVGFPDTLSLEWLQVSVKPVKGVAVSVAVVWI